jgi:hypothetical protein
VSAGGSHDPLTAGSSRPGLAAAVVWLALLLPIAGCTLRWQGEAMVRPIRLLCTTMNCQPAVLTIR